MYAVIATNKAINRPTIDEAIAAAKSLVFIPMRKIEEVRARLESGNDVLCVYGFETVLIQVLESK